MLNPAILTARTRVPALSRVGAWTSAGPGLVVGKRCGNLLNLSILISRGNKTKKDFPSSGE